MHIEGQSLRRGQGPMRQCTAGGLQSLRVLQLLPLYTLPVQLLLYTKVSRQQAHMQDCYSSQPYNQVCPYMERIGGKKGFQQSFQCLCGGSLCQGLPSKSFRPSCQEEGAIRHE